MNPTLDAIEGIAKFILDYAVTLAALGALTMAIQEAVKKIFGIPGVFHRNALQAWMGVDGGAARKHYCLKDDSSQRQQARALPITGGRYSPVSAYGELLHLTTGLATDDSIAGSKSRTGISRHIANALFELELPQMMGQIQEAADATLNNPGLYPSLYAFLTRGCAESDAEEWASAMIAGAAPSTDSKKLADLYGRIRMLAKRQLDAFQTITAYRWRDWNQLSAMMLGAVLLLLAQAMAMSASHSWPKMLLVSLLGGMLAPIAKDLVDALNKVKDR